MFRDMVGKLSSFQRVPVAIAATIGLGCGFANAAHAAVEIHAEPLVAARVETMPCPQFASPSSGLIASQAAQVSTSKSAAILGGQPSALERIRQQQAKSDGSSGGGAAAQLARLAPAALRVTGTLQSQSICFAQPSPARTNNLVANYGTALPRKGNSFLASKLTPIARSPFDGDWRRVSNARVGASAVKMVLAGHHSEGAQLLSDVNQWVNRNVTYAEDRALWKQADYWAPASVTLALRRGDCEDFAIAKMQLLAAAGVREEDMFLTIARDLVRNADHAVLVVRMDGRFWVLDNNTDQLLDGDYSYDYRPIVSYNAGKKWVHGY